MAFNAEQSAEIRRLIAKAWADEGFKAALLADPHAALASEGITLDGDLQIRIHANAGNTYHFILPEPPSEALSDDALEDVAGGFNVTCYGGMNVCCTSCP